MPQRASKEEQPKNSWAYRSVPGVVGLLAVLQVAFNGYVVTRQDTLSDRAEERFDELNAIISETDATQTAVLGRLVSIETWRGTLPVTLDFSDRWHGSDWLAAKETLAEITRSIRARITTLEKFHEPHSQPTE